MDKSNGLLPGLLDMLILKAVSLPAAARVWSTAADQPDFRGSSRGGVRCGQDYDHR